MSRSMKSIFIALLGVAMLTAGDDWSKNKEAIDKSVEKHQKELIKISDAIWHNAELALEEYKSSKILADYAEKNGFSVERGVAGMPTAFIATYGSGRPRIGILGEFDANAGISQKLQTSKEALIEGAPGHGCGHNLFGTGSLGAVIAVKELMEKGQIKGTVVFMVLLQKRPFLEKYGLPGQAFSMTWMYVWIGIQGMIWKQRLKAAKHSLIFGSIFMERPPMLPQTLSMVSVLWMDGAFYHRIY